MKVEVLVKKTVDLPKNPTLEDLQRAVKELQGLKKAKQKRAKKTEKPRKRRKAKHVKMPRDESLRNLLVKKWEGANKTQQKSIARDYGVSVRHMKKTIYYLKNPEKWRR